ncbi:hypothetical protein KUCAC02_017790, partial [Chaenocephalus aceratus]
RRATTALNGSTELEPHQLRSLSYGTVRDVALVTSYRSSMAASERGDRTLMNHVFPNGTLRAFLKEQEVLTLNAFAELN